MSSQRQRLAKYFVCLIKSTLTCRVFSQGSKPAVHKLQFTIKCTKQQPPLNLISFKLTSSRSASWLRVHILCYNYASDARSTIVTRSFRRGPNVTAHQGEGRGERWRIPIQPIPALCPPLPAPSLWPIKRVWLETLNLTLPCLPALIMWKSLKATGGGWGPISQRRVGGWRMTSCAHIRGCRNGNFSYWRNFFFKKALKKWLRVIQKGLKVICTDEKEMDDRYQNKSCF